MSVDAAPAQPPPPAQGCCGMGCGMLAVLFFILALAFSGGGLWALREFQHKYFPTEPLPLDSPAPAAPDAEAAPAPTPDPARAAELRDRWDNFLAAGEQGRRSRIELTAAEINTLIDSDPQLQGRGFVTVTGNEGRVRVSIPLEGFFMLGGRYLNAEGTVVSSPDGDPQKARITDVTLGNQPMGDDIIDRRLFGFSTLRQLLTEWLEENNIATFRIENGRVIGETRGR
jgi:hypothetical protein